MRLEEIEPNNAAEEQVKRQRAAARAAKDKANQLKARADAAAARQKMLKSRQPAGPSVRAPETTIKPGS